MTIGVAVKSRILELCESNHITVNMLATKSGLTQSTLSNIVGGRNHSATVSTIQKICDGLDIPIIQFFDSPLFLDIEQEVK